LERNLLREAGDAGISGGCVARVPNTANLWFGGIDGPALIREFDDLGVAVSGGSAYNAEVANPFHHVLLAMGMSMKQATSSVRFSPSKQTTGEEVDFVIWQVSEALEEMRKPAHACDNERSCRPFISSPPVELSRRCTRSSREPY
jgi:cysteine desulfurase